MSIDLEHQIFVKEMKGCVRGEMAPKGITELSKPPTALEKKIYKESVDKCKDQIAD